MRTTPPPVPGAPSPRRRALPLRGLAASLLVVSMAACGSASSSTSAPSTAAATVASTTTVAPTTTSTEAPTTTSPPTTAAPTTTSPPTTVAPPLLRTPTPDAPLRTLILGDSTAYEVGNAIVRSNPEGLLATEVLFKTSSGITRQDFFDWIFYLKWVVDNNPPEVMLLSLGANDAQPIVSPDGVAHQVHEDGWRAEYLRRVDDLSRHIAASGTTLYWIGQPLAKSEGYSAGMSVINSVYQEVAREVDKVEYIDLWSVLSGPEGEYVKSIEGPDGQPIEIRAEDDIHLTNAGGDLGAAHVWDVLRQDWGG